MPCVLLRGPLKARADGRADHDVPGDTVAAVLTGLERAQPALLGWILDERGHLRRHINVFVNGEQGDAETPVGAADRVDVLPAISGGAPVTELLVGTKKGLFVLEGTAGDPFVVAARAFAGEPVEYALRDPRTGRLFASVTSAFYGPKLWFTDGDLAGDWQQAAGLALPDGAGVALERIWTVVCGEEDGTLYCGADPGVLFRSDDDGTTWTLNRGLWEHPTRPLWQPGGGGMCLHSIATWPGDPDRLAVAMSATGVWLSEDRGQTWERGNAGLAANYVPDDTPPDAVPLCVHRLHRAPTRPQRLYLQFHGGVYRSDDAGRTWADIADGLPSDFGFPLVLDPVDADCAYVIPLAADTDRVTPDGMVRVYVTRDAGATWNALGDGLPQQDAYLTILREAFDRTGGEADVELYFGATNGDVFGSGDGGATWGTAATRLPPVFSVTARRRAA